MDQNELDEGTAAPAFQKVLDHLRDQISAGALKEHAALPSERTLAKDFNISRMTARRALVALEMEGVAYNSKRRGRFVSPKRLTYNIGSVVSFKAHADQLGIELKIEVISAEQIPASAELSAALSVPEGEALYRYTRLFRANGHPTFVEEEIAVARYFPGLLDHDLRQSTTLLMEREYDMISHTGDIVIRMRGLKEQEAMLLELPSFQAGIELKQITYSPDGIAFLFARQMWRGELAEFTAHAMVTRPTASL
ncbi:MAG: GntR family transcriptional regulator [Pseudomonadota bacterium]